MAQFLLSIFFGHKTLLRYSIGIAFWWLPVCWFNLFVLYRLISLSSSSSSFPFQCVCDMQFIHVANAKSNSIKWSKNEEIVHNCIKLKVCLLCECNHFLLFFCSCCFLFWTPHYIICVWILLFLCFESVFLHLPMEQSHCRLQLPFCIHYFFFVQQYCNKTSVEQRRLQELYLTHTEFI